METLLVLTDFSPNATHAAEFGYEFAKQIKANIILCNAVIVPAEIPQAGVIVWPVDEYDVLMDDSTDELKELKTHLREKDNSEGFKPNITYTNEAGVLTDVVTHLLGNKKIDVLVMGSHGNFGLSGFIMGNHNQNVINKLTKPLLIVPAKAPFTTVKKIAFATDFTCPKKDLEIIYELVPLARKLNAEILLTHVYDDKYHFPEFQKWINDFLTEISNKADYPHIYYRIIKNHKADEGLDWLCLHGQIDMLAMVHRKRGFFESLLNTSHTKKLADRISIPLLVYPEKG